MKDQLAERLLARVMDWTPEKLADERPLLQALATYKYDEYQRFYPGQRFIETLALWLDDLKGPGEKELAYDFVRHRLVFFSTAEVNHLVSMAYPDFIRPHLLQGAAKDAGINPYHVSRVAASDEFARHERSCLFLGLSDGARTDVFRRMNEGSINHEQVLQTYEISPERVDKALKKLRGAITERWPLTPDAAEARFQTIVLLDDFSASGTSYLRIEDGKPDGKISEFIGKLIDQSHPCSDLVEIGQVRILVVLYIATEQAIAHLRQHLLALWGTSTIIFDILVVHPLGDELRILPGDPLQSLLEAYYDECIETEHTRKGGVPIVYGYAGCGLPVVLSHNTPNNSIYPLWEKAPKLRALFPRVDRHTAV